MRYVHVETGVVIETPSFIIGDAWKPEKDIQEEKQVKEKEVVEEEYVEEEIDLSEMTNRELEQFAKEHEIPLLADDKRNKENLIKAITKAFEE